ncbi:maf protein [Hahella chejuensis KCTC 2396]|uniref:7-methyl-GTP pyrophosphatase n=1 Tax=Hahella chejuensis (strain KCTC 2396) TaxID=349521 RepID=NTPPB_HAHCH|nr:nucleoside triphosphate pyrophosphatase [Hahella chejuensis]Q2SK56.1 RecName: Full=7-methyl-GTP pyrophosphatase; Short=m(7)GTP pyrophosphatase [Hahella chejuensis KCTC 2396]ABC28968.1 maf protein [Hahella chejuensis KCTC 2396]
MTNKSPHPSIILGSTSPYRAALLQKLNLNFQQAAPYFDEQITPTSLAPRDIAINFAKEKAESLREQFPDHLIIGSDQTAALNGLLLRKPGDKATAIKQLAACSGESVTFYSGLALINTRLNTTRTCVDWQTVYFRDLSREEIERYIELEKPYDCVGSFKVEGLGISLFEKIEGKDPNTLIGLPLIELITLLKKEGLRIP